MKGTEHFVSVIKSYLDNRASYDELFAVAYAKPHKNIEDCATYIINEAYKSGCAGLSDDEVYSLAVHFYPKYIFIQSIWITIIDIQSIISSAR